MPYLKPFPDTKISSKFGFRSLAGGTFHEGVDYRLAMRTPLPAIAPGVVVARGETKKYGKYAVVKADAGGYYRWHAADEIRVQIGERVTVGQTIALSGMSGFWSTGPHGHLQCTKTINPNTYIDPLTTFATTADVGAPSTPFQEDDEMSAKAEQQIEAIYAALWNGGKNTIDGKVQTFNYGILPIVVHNQTLIAQLKGQVAALSAAVSAVSGGTPINLTAIEAAAEKGAREALDGLTFKAEAS